MWALEHTFMYLQVTDFTDKVNFYIMNAVTFFKSMWSQVKANAALLVGKKMHNTCIYNVILCIPHGT